jgi:hypothetical protein
MKPGDIIEVSNYITGQLERGVVVNELNFEEYCGRHDILMLEYDISEAWNHWEACGPLYEVLSVNGTVVVWWDSDRA